MRDSFECECVLFVHTLTHPAHTEMARANINSFRSSFKHHKWCETAEPIIQKIGLEWYEIAQAVLLIL